jgi:hypothetical protein
VDTIDLEVWRVVDSIVVDVTVTTAAATLYLELIDFTLFTLI